MKTQILLVSALSLAFGAAALSQTAQAPTAPAAPTANPSRGDCEALWMAADTNKDGFVSEQESARYFAAHRWANKPIADGKLARDAFLTNCTSGMYLQAKAEAGAPLSGANSFTESQARDRAISYGFSDVSALTKDDKGVWRGTAKREGKQGGVAIDYKGNVVFQ